jgi:hypothetical protein
MPGRKTPALSIEENKIPAFLPSLWLFIFILGSQEERKPGINHNSTYFDKYMELVYK